MLFIWNRSLESKLKKTTFQKRSLQLAKRNNILMDSRDILSLQLLIYLIFPSKKILTFKNHVSLALLVI